MDNHDIAVVVFATVPGVDAQDAARRLEGVLRALVPWEKGRHYLFAPHLDQRFAVHDFAEVNDAMGRGYLRVTATDRARREHGG